MSTSKKNPQAQLYAYMDGWRDGAGGKPMVTTKTDALGLSTEYVDGYTEGRMDRGREMRRVAEVFGASINILRAQ